MTEAAVEALDHAIEALDHVQLAAPPGSEDALRAYYAGVLGMTELPKPPVLAARGGVWFAAGGCVLHLGAETGFRPARKAHPGIRVRGIDALAERLAAAGAPVAWDDALPGHRRFYSEDPVGNRLEFLEPREPRAPGAPGASGEPGEQSPTPRSCNRIAPSSRSS